MTEGARDLVKVEILGFTESRIYVENKDFRLIRVLPGGRYSDGGARALTPEELNQAITLWMNKHHEEKSTIDKIDHEMTIPLLCKKIEELNRAMEDWKKQLWPVHKENHDALSQCCDRFSREINDLKAFQKHIEKQMQACLKDLNGGMQPGDKVSLDSRVSKLEKDAADYPVQTLYKRQIAYRQGFHTTTGNIVSELAKLQKKVNGLELHNGLSTDARIERLERARDVLIGRVDALEKQNGEIPPDPENYFLVDLGHPFKPIYIRKPEPGK